jgi:hypothetical protein
MHSMSEMPYVFMVQCDAGTMLQVKIWTSTAKLGQCQFAKKQLLKFKLFMKRPQAVKHYTSGSCSCRTLCGR